MDFQLIIELGILAVLCVVARIMYLIHKNITGFSKESPKRTPPCRTVICIGSGGHTTEMLSLVNSLDFKKYSPRYYICAKSDSTSFNKIHALENAKTDRSETDFYKIIKIPRSRVVNQSYITSVVTTIYSILYSIPHVFYIRPELILCNGPGTCIPICLLGFLLKTAFIVDTRIFFIESFCRTRSFSLSGRILMFFADNFMVQWPDLRKKLKRAEYIGRLM